LARKKDRHDQHSRDPVKAEVLKLSKYGMGNLDTVIVRNLDDDLVRDWLFGQFVPDPTRQQVDL
jgi:hypothetical protein